MQQRMKLNAAFADPKGVKLVDHNEPQSGDETRQLKSSQNK
jgi:hypothetical protein